MQWQKNCKICGVAFAGGRFSRFCPACQKEQKTEKLSQPPAPQTCTHCKNTFTPPDTHICKLCAACTAQVETAHTMQGKTTLAHRTCVDCGAVFYGGPRARRCLHCKKERTRELNTACKQRKKAGLHRPLGSIDTCMECGGGYSVTCPTQLYCPDCAPEAQKKADAQQGMEYYLKNRDAINLIRTKKRARQGMKK